MTDNNDGWTDAPWATEPSSLAGAFRWALARAQALEDEPGSAISITDTQERRGLMLLGTGINSEELQTYVSELAGGYRSLLQAGAPAGDLLRGAIIQGVLIGDRHGRASVAFDVNASALTATRPQLTDAQRRMLATNPVQWIFDLEADRLERMAATIGAFGLADVAELMRAASTALRETLELDGTVPESGQHP